MRRHSPFRVPHSAFPIRTGLTLVELLVVITIMLILTAIAIPMMATGVEGRRTRETARLVSVFLSGARNRAIEAGHPVGVQFERLAANPNASMVLSYVEVPPPHSGDTINATVTIGAGGQIMGFSTGTTLWPGIIKPGDIMKLNYQGYTYRIFAGEPFYDANSNGVYDGTGTDYYDSNRNGSYDSGEPSYIDLNTSSSYDGPASYLDANGYLAADPSSGSSIWSLGYVGTMLPPPIKLNPGTYPFQIFRQPVKAPGTPLQLPEGTVVDLTWSGEGINGLIVGSNPAQIIFGPSGSVSSVANFESVGNVRAPQGPIHLLIGKPEKAIAGGETTAKDGIIYNYQSLTNLWVSIGQQTGQVSTAEVTAWYDKNADDVKNSYSETDTDHAKNEVVRTNQSATYDPFLKWPEDGANSRGLARAFQTMGGR